jgi:hypothetical protein
MIKIAKTKLDVMIAWNIVYREYLETGLIQPNDKKIYYWEQAIGKQSTIFISHISEIDTGTVTLIEENKKGFPLEKIYPQEIKSFKEKGYKLTEICLLARKEQYKTNLEMFLDFIRYPFWYSKGNGTTHFILGAHPKHTNLYIKLFGFKPFSTKKLHKDVNNAIVSPIILDLENFLKNPPSEIISKYLFKTINKSFFENKYDFSDW